MKNYYRWFGQALMAVSLSYFIWFLIDNAESLSVVNWSSGMCLSLTGATAIYTIVLLLGACSWSIFLYGTGESVQFEDSFKIFLISQFAKYIPGNVAQYLGRIALARKYEINISQVISATVLESGWVILAGVFVVMISFLFNGDVLFQNTDTLPSFWQLGLLAGGGLGLSLLVVWVINHCRAILSKKDAGNGESAVPSIMIFVVCFLLYLLIFSFLGLSVYILLEGAFQSSHGSYWTTTSMFCLAWLAGFLTPGAPAGLGIREALLISFLTPIHGAGVALGVTLLMRIVTTLGDGLVFLGALFAVRKDHVESSV